MKLDFESIQLQVLLIGGAWLIGGNLAAGIVSVLLGISLVAARLLEAKRG